MARAASCPANTWRFARLEAGKVVADSTHVYLEGGFEPHRLYDIVYRAQNPTVVGLGPAAVRDTMSWLKYGNPEALSIPTGSITKAVAYGASQSGRFLRTFLYYGFNADESEPKVARRRHVAHRRAAAGEASTTVSRSPRAMGTRI